MGRQCCRTRCSPSAWFCTPQALDEDQPGDRVEHRKVFEEDRDFNQGALTFLNSTWLFKARG